MFLFKSKTCQFQEKFIPQGRIVIKSTRRFCNCIAPPETNYINDHTPNVSYLKSCYKYQLQYVGETCLKFNNKLNWRNSCFRYPKNCSFCQILNDQFEKGYCQDS